MCTNWGGDWVVGAKALQAEDGAGVYGPLDTAPPGAFPGACWGASGWKDASGNLWMFGGQGDVASVQDRVLINDIWEWVPGGYDTHLGGGVAGTFTRQWIWQGGSNTGNQNGVYGTQGTAAAGNIPGGRWAAATATDPSGNAWLFGGQGYDSAGKVGLLNDISDYI